MEIYSVFGLHKRPLAELSQRIADWGFNCVRMPVSIDLWYKDPPVPDFALAANPELQKLALTGMKLLDRTISALTGAGLLVLQNIHTSHAGWCCDLGSEEGLWDNPAYNASVWLLSIGALARRYRHDPRVVAFDLRNEIHDSPTRVITWGTSADVRTDWKVATEAAAREVYRAAPDVLVVVSGLCSSYDLRLLHANPPQLPDQSRLVYTVHYYAFARWWYRLDDMLRTNFELDWDDVSRLTTIALGVTLPPLLLCLLCTRHVLYRATLRADGASACLTLSAWCAVGATALELAAAYIWDFAYELAACAATNLEGAAFRTVALVLYCCAASLLLGALALWGFGWRAPRVAEAAAAAAAASTSPAALLGQHRPPLLLNAGLGGDPEDQSPKSRTSSRDHAGVPRVAPPVTIADQFCITPLPLAGGAGGSAVVGVGAVVGGASEPLPVERLGDAYTLGTAPLTTAPRHARGRRRCCRCCRCWLWLHGLLLTTALIGAGAVLLRLSLRVGTYSMFHDELAAKWLVDAHIDAPVWVGEFGAGGDYWDTKTRGGAGTYWMHMLRFLREYQLDFAYWPYNGDAWVNSTRKWDDEDFGLLDREYGDARRPGQLADLQKLLW